MPLWRIVDRIGKEYAACYQEILIAILTFYHYLIKISLCNLAILKSFPIFAVLFADILIG